MSRIKGSNVTGAPIELTSAAPVDAKSIVDLKSDLITKAVWEAPSSAGANAGKMFCYFGMQVYVGGDTTENNGLYVLQNNTNEVDDASGTGANKAALKAANWVRISQTDTKIEEIKSGLEGAIATKLDKDFVTTYSQGTLEEDTVFAARSDNTADATNVYITGQQIKAFAAAAVSDKATTLSGYGITDAYTKQEVESAIDAKIGTFVEINASFSSLDSITDPKSNVIYLIPVSDPEEQNVKEEYIWTGSAWELIGTTSVDLSGYQTKALSSAITVDKVEQTTVEGALTAINTLAAANKAEIAGVDAKVENVISGYVKTNSNASLTGLTVDSKSENTSITVKSDVSGYAYGFTLAQNSAYTQINGVKGIESVYGTLTTAGNATSKAGKLVIDSELQNYVRTDAYILKVPYIEATSSFKVSNGGSNAFQFNTNTSSYNSDVPTLEINGPDASAVVQGNVTTGGTDHGGKIIITDADVVDTASVVNVPALKDGSATAVYTSAAADTTFAKADASNVSAVASWKSKLGFVSTTGDETIAGVKTFSDGINIAGKVEKTVAGSTTQTATLSEGVTHATIRWVSASTEINYEVCIAAGGEVTLLKEVISGNGENGITNIANNVITFGSEGKAYIVEYK